MVESHVLRSRIWTKLQHPYHHSLSEFVISNPALPGVTNMEDAFNWLVAVLYPNTQPSVATPGDLPTGTDTPNVGDVTPTLRDYRVVLDDGDGKAASYRYEQREGDVAAIWYKIYDMDWGEQSILSNFLLSTQDVYVYKHGVSDKDENGDVLLGTLSGQHIYGGDLANQNLTLHANSGDGVGANTGFIQFDDHTRPIGNNVYDVGTVTDKFKTGHFGTSILVGDITISNGQIISSSGALTFNDENLTTTGTLTAGITTVNGQLVMKQITTPSNPAATFDSLYFKADEKLYRLTSGGVEKLVGLEFSSTNDNRLIRSNGTGGDAIQESGVIVSDLDAITGVTALTIDNLFLDGNTISSLNTNGDINLTPDGTGKVVTPNLKVTGLTNDKLLVPRTDGTLTSTGIDVDGSDNVTGMLSLDVANFLLTGNTLSSTDTDGNITITPDGTGEVVFSKILRPSSNGTLDLGKTSNRIQNLFLSGSIGDGTDSIAIATLLSFRDALVGIADGHTLFYDNASGKFLPSLPDLEIDHGEITGLLDDDHTQYVLLSGRSGGQEIVGDTDASGNLLLSATSNAAKGSIFAKDNLSPFVDASYSAGWNGTDLGDPTHYFRNLYTKGELFGARLENILASALPAFSANNKGRVFYATDTEKLYVDTGSQLKVAGVGKHLEDLAFNGVELTKTINVSANIGDARNALIQLLDNTNNFERIYCKIEATSQTDVRVTTTIPLPAGSYRLIVME